MPIPGFTAETSVGPTLQVYRPLPHLAAAASSVAPQWDDGVPLDDDDMDAGESIDSDDDTSGDDA